MSYLGRQRPTETTSSVLRSTYTGNGSTTTYALPGPVANETSIIATINGVTQQDAAYSTDGSNIIFVAAPALNDDIEIRTISAVAMSYAPSAGSVVTGILADGAVTTAKINDASVTGAKIASGVITQDKFSTNVAGNGPAFSAYQSSAQTGVANTTFTKITFDTESFDTNSNFGSSRFTPTVAGYYQLNASSTVGSLTTSHGLAVFIYKNGSIYVAGAMSNANAALYPQSIVSSIVYFNGSTDYAEIYVYGSFGGSYALLAGMYNTYFSAAMIRSA